MRRLLLTGVLVVGALSGFAERATEARFTNSVNSTGNQFSAGTIVLGVSANSPSGCPSSPPVACSTTLTMSDLVPGDLYYGEVTLTNTDTDAVNMQFSMSTAITAESWAPPPAPTPLPGPSPIASNKLATASQFQLTIRKKTTNACTSQDGTLLYGPSTLSGASITAGASTAVAAGASQTLCFKINLTSGASVLLQEQSATATFTFTGQSA